ncbi:DUF4333 domain-containing protein [Aldersonia kunmingensis]|uniref:DUF4333 domain-containing protein n=1 Tax=Aldersonia kunmingensis TaxID=408066 RepID=UPI00083281A0|nr:DUF4333 domain-containing protein [Aldersonia kunmingensis]
MPKLLRTLATACCAVALSAPVLAGCSAEVSIGNDSVDKDKVAEQISTQLTEQVGTKPDSVECPENLDAKVGATLTCTLTHEGVSYDVDVTVTSVDDDKNVKFDIEVADQPK